MASVFATVTPRFSQRLVRVPRTSAQRRALVIQAEQRTGQLALTFAVDLTDLPTFRSGTETIKHLFTAWGHRPLSDSEVTVIYPQAKWVSKI